MSLKLRKVCIFYVPLGEKECRVLCERRNQKLSLPGSMCVSQGGVTLAKVGTVTVCCTYVQVPSVYTVSYVVSLTLSFPLLWNTCLTFHRSLESGRFLITSKRPFLTVSPKVYNPVKPESDRKNSETLGVKKTHKFSSMMRDFIIP